MTAQEKIATIKYERYATAEQIINEAGSLINSKGRKEEHTPLKTLKRVLLFLLALYLFLSLAASAIVQWSDNNDITREIVNNRYGLMIINYDPASDTLVFLSPFNNYPDIFLLVIDFTNGIDFYTDGLDYFGHY